MAERVLLSRVKNCRIGITVLRWNGSLGKNPREAAPENLLGNKRGFVCFLKAQNTSFIFRCLAVNLAALGMLKLFLNSSEVPCFSSNTKLPAIVLVPQTCRFNYVCLTDSLIKPCLQILWFQGFDWPVTQAGIYNRKGLGDYICCKASFS